MIFLKKLFRRAAVSERRSGQMSIWLALGFSVFLALYLVCLDRQNCIIYCFSENGRRKSCRPDPDNRRSRLRRADCSPCFLNMNRIF